MYPSKRERKRILPQKIFQPTVTRISCYVRWQRHHSWKWYLCPVAVSNLKQKILGLLLLVLSLIHSRLEWIFENKIGGTHFTADLLSSFLIYFRMYLQERSEKSYRKQFDVTSKVNTWSRQRHWFFSLKLFFEKTLSHWLWHKILLFCLTNFDEKFSAVSQLKYRNLSYIFFRLNHIKFDRSALWLYLFQIDNYIVVIQKISLELI